MSKSSEVTLRITISDECFTELSIIGMRKGKMKPAEVIREVLEKYTDRKKDSQASTS